MRNRANGSNTVNEHSSRSHSVLPSGESVCGLCVGMRNRANGSNTVNEHSSRSHSVLTLNIDSEIYDEEDEKLCMTRHGKLAFVDLAGSLAARFHYSAPEYCDERVCLSVCLFGCFLSAIISPELHVRSSPNFLFMLLRMTVVRSSSGGVFPVSWMTSYLRIS